MGTASHSRLQGGWIKHALALGIFLLGGGVLPREASPPEVLYTFPERSQGVYPKPAEEFLDWTRTPTRPSLPTSRIRLQSPISSQRLLQEVAGRSDPLLSEFPEWPHSTLTRQFLEVWLGYDTFSRLRYDRGVGRLIPQKDRDQLGRYLMEHRWTLEALDRFANDPDLAHRPDYLFRILISIHTAAHFFDLPYPSLFCLFFQESKLDYRLVSRTGARGVGQLTSIALEQIRTLRKDPENEQLLQLASRHLAQVYGDPLLQDWFEHLKLQVTLPRPEAPRNELRTSTPTLYSLVTQTAKLLRSEKNRLGRDEALIWILARKIRRGEILPERYSRVHWAYDQIAEKQLASDRRSVFHIETNILLSSLLFQHYYRYHWRNNSQETIELRPEVRAMMAVASYNNGQSGIRRLLSNLEHEFQQDLKEVSSEWIASRFTARRLAKALRRPYQKIREVTRHVRRATACSEAMFPFR